MKDKKTVLIVDDFESTRFILDFTLQNAGYKVLKADSGQNALNHLNGQKVDLVISDFNMPEMNGVELVKKIRAIQQYESIPILILSTEIDKEVKAEAQKAGITAWVKKPFKMEEFLKIIKKAIR